MAADPIDLACPYCAGRFQEVAEAENRAAACPHCGRSVTVPAAPRQVVPPAPPATKFEVEGPPDPRSPFDFAEPAKVLVNRRGEPVPLRRLTPEEKERYRRRLNLLFALLGMVILAIALVVLLRIRP